MQAGGEIVWVCAARVVQGGRPRDSDTKLLGRPLVLVFGAAPARQRWREALRALGDVEGRTFIFVA